MEPKSEIMIKKKQNRRKFFRGIRAGIMHQVNLRRKDKKNSGGCSGQNVPRLSHTLVPHNPERVIGWVAEPSIG
jgi:hypothetical protein